MIGKRAQIERVKMSICRHWQIYENYMRYIDYVVRQRLHILLNIEEHLIYVNHEVVEDALRIDIEVNRRGNPHQFQYEFCITILDLEPRDLINFINQKIN